MAKPRYRNVSCGTCAWFNTTDQSCHRSTPFRMENGKPGFPPVDRYDWCAEWETPADVRAYFDSRGAKTLTSGAIRRVK